MAEDGTGRTEKAGAEFAPTAGVISLGCGILLWVTLFYYGAVLHFISPAMAIFVYIVKVVVPWTGAAAGLFAVLRGAHRRAAAWIGLLLNGSVLALYALSWLM